MFHWPDNKKFAFTIVDDTDNATVFNIKPVYDFLYSHGFKITKTLWVYPPRDKFAGQCLQDEEYRQFIYELQGRHFEIALHGVGSGSFKRERFWQVSMNFINLWIFTRICILTIRRILTIFIGVQRGTLDQLDFFKPYILEQAKILWDQSSFKAFWGDISKRHFKYIRNHTFNGINTLKYDPKMPYQVKAKEEYSNYWFSSSDGHTIEEFNALVTPENILKLEKEGGLCIVYTHFASGFVNKEGQLNQRFKENMKFLSTRNGWFAPAGEILDYMLEQRKEINPYASSFYRAKLDMLWVRDRIIKKVKTGR